MVLVKAMEPHDVASARPRGIAARLPHPPDCVYSSAMTMISDTATLAAFCERLSTAPFVTVDTEFLRDKTYWPQLCLVQVAGPDDAAVIDALAPGIDLAPLYALMANQAVLKVFHAARQDVEIFVNLTGTVPVPMFDTQIAAM